VDDDVRAATDLYAKHDSIRRIVESEVLALPDTSELKKYLEATRELSVRIELQAVAYGLEELA
jgi:hypothetical protein